MPNAKIGRQSFLPPKCPFPIVPPSFADHGFIPPKGNPKPRDRQRHHQRTSSESFLIEEQPSWLDDLLDEPESPVRRPVHRRSSSDSFAYADPSNGFDHASYYADSGSFGRVQGRGWESGLNMAAYQVGNVKSVNSGASPMVREVEDSGQESKDVSQARQAQSENDTKRVKQQFAQRSRVRKLQYIAELERHVQALQVEGFKVSAELEFLDQQNLILNLENKTLKQRLESLSQAQHIKHLQQEMLEREIARLKLQHQLQLQKQQQPVPTHGRRSSRDLDLEFAALSLKHKESNSARDPATGPLYI